MNDTHWREHLKEAAAQPLPGTAAQRAVLLGLFLLALVLRLWNLPHIPYTHDEISALLRVFPGFWETIQKGVAVDAHPPGVQVFLWAWTRLFGMQEAVVKLPFILLSLLAILLLYRFAFAWCGGTVALAITALLAALQYTVLYGQTARPYAAGFFTTALLADQLTRYLGTGTRKALVGVVAGAVLSAYVHHFALMVAGLMLATGLFLVAAEARKTYLLACTGVLLAYLPNIPLFLRQLGYEGLGTWLAPPGPGWIPDYLWWLAHCCWLFAATWAVLLIGSAALRIRHRGTIRPVWAIALVWGLAPLLIGYAYSLWRAPVLQYSVLLFSFPYLLLGLLAGLRHLRSSRAVPVALATAAVAAFTLVSTRKHYQVFYHSPYVEAIKGIQAAAEHPHRLALVDAPPEKVAFYMRHWNLDTTALHFHNVRNMPVPDVAALLRSPGTASVFLGLTAGSTPELPALVQSTFPFLAERHDLEEGQAFLFHGTPVQSKLDDHLWSRLVTPEALGSADWHVDADLPTVRDSTAAGSMAPRRWDFSGREWGILLDLPVYQVAKGDNDVIEARLDAAMGPGKGLKLVTELMQGEASTFYRSQAFPTPNGQGSIVSAIPLADVAGHGQGQRLRVYVWNEGGNPAWVSSVEVRVRQGNPWLYGLFQPLKGPLHFP
ncbi:MAG: glycosyltransferase family 39 protein [Flavobacteriales bacterium]|nr:glycosyltransferase family 39 protein [Flavobacteriales bacterium]MBP9081297.1 glycosyltransferase family 39 protein [Flavobacteriales bacterium]